MDAVPDSIPAPPEGSTFRLLGVETTWTTAQHPFMIGPRHIGEYGQLDYTKGCVWPDKRGKPRCDKLYDDPIHKGQKALYVVVPDNSDLNEINGLSQYLFSIKDAATAQGIEGFAFPNEAQAATL